VIPLDEILESLDLSRARPGAGFLAALFARFNARIPFENASKIVRHAEVRDEAMRPRTPGIFWADHLRGGTGGTCFARTAALESVLAALGFRTRRVLGRVLRRGDHAALLVETPSGPSIVDVGFPLPAILPARTGVVATPLGELGVEEGPEGFRIEFREGVPDGPRSLEIFSAAVTEERFAAMWRRTFRAGSRFLRGVRLRRDLDNRVLSFSGGEVRVDDLHSRLRLGLSDASAAALAELFGIDEQILSRAMALSPPASARPGATLTSYFRVEGGAREAFDAIGTPEAYRRLLEGMGEIVREEPTSRGHRFVVDAPSKAQASRMEEDIVTDPVARRVSVVRLRGGVPSESSYAVTEREGRTLLVREARLSGEREDLLRNDSLRGRLAGALALDLLAWARLL
jgi:arylamine N-acetyltransferase